MKLPLQISHGMNIATIMIILWSYCLITENITLLTVTSGNSAMYKKGCMCTPYLCETFHFCLLLFGDLKF